jgi:hypothetical protein
MLEYFPKSKILSIITYSKEFNKIFKIDIKERKMYKVLFELPFPPLHFSTRASFNSKHIDQIVYNRLTDYQMLIKERLDVKDEENFKKVLIEYLKNIKDDQSICMLDLENADELRLAKEVNNLKYGLFHDFVPDKSSFKKIPVNLSELNIVYFSNRFQENQNIFQSYFSEIIKCPLETLKINIPSGCPLNEFRNLPKLRKFEITNSNWGSANQLINFFNVIQHLGDSLESLTLSSFTEVIEEDEKNKNEEKAKEFKKALSNFKKISHLYIRHSPKKLVDYDKFISIFQPLSYSITKLKFEADILKSKNPITLQEFPNLKKFIVKWPIKDNLNVYEISSNVECKIKYNKGYVYSDGAKGEEDSRNLKEINEKRQGYEIVLDSSGFTENEIKKIEDAINKPIIKTITFRAINSEFNEILSTYSNPNLVELELVSIKKTLDLPGILERNPNLTSLILQYLGKPEKNIIEDLPVCPVIFPDKEMGIEKLEVRCSKITNAQSFITTIKHVKKIIIDDLLMDEGDFKYFVEHFGELKELEFLYLGSIDYEGDMEMKNQYMEMLYSSLSSIKTLNHLEFKTDEPFNTDSIEKLSRNLGKLVNLTFLQLVAYEKKECCDVRKAIFQATEKLKKLKTFKFITLPSSE